MAQLAPFGFQAGQSRRSVNEYYVPASDTTTLAVGDPVKTDGNVFVGRLPDSRQSSGMLHVTKAASGNAVRGVIVGIVAGPGDNSAQSLPATKQRAYTVLVNDNPQALWDVQANNTAPLSAMAGMYASYAVGAPLGSVSSTVVDADSIGSTVSDLLIAEVLRNDGASSLLRVAFVQHEMAAAGGSPQIGAQIQSLVSGERNRLYPLENYGTIYQAVSRSDAFINAASAVLTLGGYSFTSADVGKAVGIKGAGVISADYVDHANDGVYVGTILSVSGGAATLSEAATNTVSNAKIVFGWPVDAAVTAAVAACRADFAADGIPGELDFPEGDYIVQAAQAWGSGVGLKGAGRKNTRIYVVKLADNANNSVTASWIRKAAGEGGALYDSVNLHDFTLLGTFYAARRSGGGGANNGGYGPDMKMLHMSLTADSTVQRVGIIDNPSTALGYDESENCLLADNVILFPGRLARPNLTTGSAGGSGIGIAIGGAAAATARGGRGLSMVVRNNFIRGNWTTANGINGTGRAGINIEASADTTIPTTYQGGVILEGNTIEGFFSGIVDSGGLGTIARGNVIRKCTNGIKAGTNGAGTGAVARDMLITENDISDSITISTALGVGVLVTTTSAVLDTRGRVKVIGNKIRGCAAYGIQINGATGFPLENVDVVHNDVSESGLSGIRISGTTLKGLTVDYNRLISNGKLGTGGNTAPISVAASCVWTDGSLRGNTYLDYATVPTQDATASISTSATMTGVFTDLQGTATLVGGTVTVTRQQITATSVVRVTRRTTGGTVGHLSVTMTAGASFTITSSSGTDTSTVLWEIVQF